MDEITKRLIFGVIIMLIYIISFIYMIINSKKYPNVKVLLWVLLNLFFPCVGFVGYMIDTRFFSKEKTNKKKIEK